MKGRDCAAVLGLCSDPDGWFDQMYLKLPQNLSGWTTISQEFNAPEAAKLRVMICNNKRELGEILIDNIKIQRLEAK